jgi:hypothetical protein
MNRLFLNQRSQELTSIAVICEYRFLAISTIHDVIRTARNVRTESSAHAWHHRQELGQSDTIEITPKTKRHT